MKYVLVMMSGLNFWLAVLNAYVGHLAPFVMCALAAAICGYTGLKRFHLEGKK